MLVLKAPFVILLPISWVFIAHVAALQIMLCNYLNSPPNPCKYILLLRISLTSTSFEKKTHKEATTIMGGDSNKIEAHQVCGVVSWKRKRLV